MGLGAVMVLARSVAAEARRAREEEEEEEEKELSSAVMSWREEDEQ